MHDMSTHEDRRVGLLGRAIAYSLDNRLVKILAPARAAINPGDWNGQ